MPLRFDPFRDFDRLANVNLGSQADGVAHTGVPMDVVRSADEVRVYFDLPGIDPDAIDLTVERNRLRLRATRGFELPEGERMVVRERPSGDFTRTLVLSEGLDAARVSARFERGVLQVAIPVADLAQPRRVQIGTVAQRSVTARAHNAPEPGDAEQDGAGESRHVSAN